MVSVSKIAVSVAAALSSLAMPLRVLAQDYPPQSAPNAVSTAAPTAPQPGQLEQLVAPIALYPDSLLSQILMASTYPLEVVEAARWRQAHPNVTGPDLETALRDQDWDPSVKSLVEFPTVLDMMNDRIGWTSELGDAFLAQQAQLMDTVQQLRSRAQAAGNLQSTQQQVVINDPGGPSNIIRIEPAQPDVIYVPTYNPTVVYGPWMYPAYEPFYWYPPGYIAAGAIFGFTAGFFVGHALWGGYDWHRHSVNIVNVRNYNNYWHGHYAGGPWQHDPAHRRGVGYGDGPGRNFYHGGDRGNHFGAREQFRPRADAGRRDLGRVDRSSLQERGGPGGGFSGGRPSAGGPGGGGGPRGDGGGFHGGGSPGGREGGFRGGSGGGREGGSGGFHGGGGGGGRHMSDSGPSAGQPAQPQGISSPRPPASAGFSGGGSPRGDGGGWQRGQSGGGIDRSVSTGGSVPRAQGGGSTPRPQFNGGVDRSISAGSGMPRAQGGGGMSRPQFSGGAMERNVSTGGGFQRPSGGGGGGAPRSEGGGGGGRHFGGGGGGGHGGGGGGHEGGGRHGG